MRHDVWFATLLLLFSGRVTANDVVQVGPANVPGPQAKPNLDAYFYPNNQYGSDPRLNEVAKCLTVVDVPYLDYDGYERRGRLVVNRDSADDIRKAFEFMKKIGYPVKSVSPVNNYGWSDDASMAQDNTSAYNFRTIKNSTKLSNHSFGYAIDINPKCNPDVRLKNGTQVLDPPSAVYPSNEPCAIEGKLGKQVNDFFQKNLHWCWGGDYTAHRDLQHFEKPPVGMDCNTWRRAGASRDSNGPYCSGR